MPSSVTSIGDNAFQNCNKIPSIITLNLFQLSGNDMSSSVFDDDVNIYVPYQSYGLYEASPQWNSYNILANDRIVPISVNADTVIAGTTVSFQVNNDCITKSASFQWYVNAKKQVLLIIRLVIFLTTEIKLHVIVRSMTRPQ